MSLMLENIRIKNVKESIVVLNNMNILKNLKINFFSKE